MTGRRSLFCKASNVAFAIQVGHMEGTLARRDITLRVISLLDGIEIDDSLFTALNKGFIDFALLRDGDVFDTWRQHGHGCNRDSVVAWRTSTTKCAVLQHALDSPVMLERWEKYLVDLEQSITSLDPKGKIVTEARERKQFEQNLHDFQLGDVTKLRGKVPVARVGGGGGCGGKMPCMCCSWGFVLFPFFMLTSAKCRRSSRRWTRVCWRQRSVAIKLPLSV